MNRGERIGLDVFLIAFAITGIILLYDGTLYLLGLPTISDHIWDTLAAWRDGGYKWYEFPPLTILLPNGVALQAIGLFAHLIAGLMKD
jgi:hypothetical protein